MMTHQTMDRRTGIRRNTDLPLRGKVDGHPVAARAVELSVDGALVRGSADREPPLVQALELELGQIAITTLARTVWARGALHAVRFVGLSEVDRLEIAEHLDRLDRVRR